MLKIEKSFVLLLFLLPCRCERRFEGHPSRSYPWNRQPLRPVRACGAEDRHVCAAGAVCWSSGKGSALVLGRQLILLPVRQNLDYGPVPEAATS